MLTLGDVLASIALLLTTCLAALSAMVLSSLLFPVRTSRAATEIERHPWKCALTGFFAGLPLALIGLVLFQVPQPVVRFVGILVWLLVLMLAAAGSGGLAQLAGKRISDASGDRTRLSAVTLGGVLVVGVAALPLAGWLILAPLLLFCSLGAGVRAMRPSHLTSAVPVTEAQ